MMNMPKTPLNMFKVVLLLCSGLALPVPAQEAPVPMVRDAEAVAEATPYKPFRRGITETVQLPASLQAVRRNLIAGKRLRTADLRDLADAGDSLAQMRFAKFLSELNDPTLIRPQVHYYSMAAYNGRDGAVPPLLSLLRGHGASLDASVLANAEAALVAQATHGHADAIAGLAKFYVAGVPFGAKGSEGIEMMAKVAQTGDHQAALDLALKLISDKPGEAGLQAAREYLEIAALSPEPAIKAMATSLLSREGDI
jgi:hypothetical protein